MILGPVRVMGAGVVVMLCVEVMCDQYCNAKQKHLRCTKSRGQSEAAVI